MRTTEQRKRADRAFRAVHTSVLKPRGFALKKLVSARRAGEVLTAVRLEIPPGGREGHFPVEVTYLAGVPVGTEPADFVWGVTGALPDASGNPRFMVHQLDDDDLVAELAGRIERDVVPFLDRFATVGDLVAFFSGGWEEAEARFLQPQSPVKRAKYLVFLAEVAGDPDGAAAAREDLAAVAAANGMSAQLPGVVREVDQRLEKWRAVGS